METKTQQKVKEILPFLEGLTYTELYEVLRDIRKAIENECKISIS